MMNKINKVLTLLAVLLFVGSMSVQAQDKIEYPEISYAGAPRIVTIAGLNVSGVEGY